jgi:orotate phosphoribosyltransferase-like protein
MGRPPDYTPDLCEKVIPLLKQGMSIAEIGLELDIGYSTIYAWMERFPDFKEAIKNGREYSKGWWEKNGRIALRDKDFNSTLWYMNMKNRFGWKDKQETEHGVANDSLMQKLIDKL